MKQAVRLGPIAVANPPHRLATARSLEVARALAPDEVSTAVLARLHDRSGIEQRNCAILDADGGVPLYGIGPQGGDDDPRVPGTAARMIAYEEHARRLAVDAAARAIEADAHGPDRITHLVTASCTGFDAPGVDRSVMDAVDLRADIRRTHVGFMGCHAAVNALAVARAFAAEDPRHRVLVVCVEISSVHFHRDQRLDRLISNTLFADGAAATVVALGDTGPELAATAATVIPDTIDVMGWRIGDYGFEMTLGAEVPAHLRANLPAWIERTLAAHELSIDAIGGWAIHPGGPRVIDAVVESLGLPEDAGATSRAVLREHGNMSSVTLLFILDRLARDSSPGPWVGLAFGPGLAGEFLLIR
ncbi:MAG: type III polyketide synthase [Planctomycetia bacterium]|nr:type III polyketide synthase [Planctomycetia bacterium]